MAGQSERAVAAPQAGGEWTADTPGGIAYTMGSTVSFACLDTLIKYLTASYPVLELAWARYVFQLVLLPFVLRGTRLRDLLRTKRLGLQIVRSMLLVGATLTFFFAVRSIPIGHRARSRPRETPTNRSRQIHPRRADHRKLCTPRHQIFRRHAASS